MRFAIVSFVCAVALGAALSSASAQTAPAAPSGTEAPAPADDLEKVVCKTLPPQTGSLIGTRRVCQTVGTWRAQERRDQDTLRMREEHRGPLFAPHAG